MKRCSTIFSFLVVGLFIMIWMLLSCNNSKQQIYTPTPYELTIPPGFPYMVIPEDNPTTVEGIQLGRMLYYDSIIDKGNERSCGKCHVQQTSFTAEENCLPHINLAWNNAYLWKGEVRGVLENSMLFEVEHFFETELKRLNAHSGYSKLFKNAFGVDKITSKEIAYALAQFVRTLNSNNSKYDRFLRGETTLTQSEEAGYKLFFTEEGDCFHCHGTILLTNNTFHNNGLDSILTPGRSEITGKQKDIGKYKTPTLRNIAFTAPYMHDGRYETLEEVIDFYSEGLVWSSTIDPLMKKAHKGGVHLNNQEKLDLIAFLKTFSDTTFITSPDFSNPFVGE